MRIGFFTSSLPSPGRKPGGVDVHIHRLGQKLVERGHQLRVFSFSPKPPDAAYQHVQMRPERLAHDKLGRLLAVPALLNTIRTDDLDVLHVHGDDWFFLRRKVPTVRTFYGSALYEATQATRLRRKISQYVTYGGEVLASRLATASYGLIPGDGAAYRVRGHLACAVDVPREAPAAELRSDVPMILFVGTWAGRKRGEMLHTVFSEHVRAVLPEAELHMVSDHCEPADGVVWWQRPSDDELVALYRQAWAFCLPSSYEGFGIPYVEAMAQGTPVLATPNPGADFVLRHGEAGVIAEDTALAGELLAVLTDRDLRARLAAVGRRRAQDFDWSSVLPTYETAYAQAIGGFSRG